MRDACNIFERRKCEILIVTGFLHYLLHCTLRICAYAVTTQIQATGQFFLVVLFIMLYKVVLTFESVDEVLKCDHSNKSY